MLVSLMYNFLLMIKPIMLLIREQTGFLRSIVKLLFFQTVLWLIQYYEMNEAAMKANNHINYGTLSQKMFPYRQRLLLLFG